MTQNLNQATLPMVLKDTQSTEIASIELNSYFQSQLKQLYCEDAMNFLVKFF